MPSSTGGSSCKGGTGSSGSSTVNAKYIWLPDRGWKKLTQSSKTFSILLLKKQASSFFSLVKGSSHSQSLAVVVVLAAALVVVTVNSM